MVAAGKWANKVTPQPPKGGENNGQYAIGKKAYRAIEFVNWLLFIGFCIPCNLQLVTCHKRCVFNQRFSIGYH